MTPKDELSRRLGCSDVVAGELMTCGLSLARAYVRLREVWSFNHMLEAKKSAAELQMKQIKKTIDRDRSKPTVEVDEAKMAKQLRRRLSSSSQKTFTAFERVEADWAIFMLARRGVPELDNLVSDKILTAVFEIAHKNHQLSQAEKVIEGRALHDAMLRDSNLLTSLGIKPA